VLTLTAPYAVVSGDGMLVGLIFAVATMDAAISTVVEGIVEGVAKINKLSTDVFAVGAAVYWDNTNRRCTSTAAGNTKIGVATVAAANPSSTVTVRLNGTF
jgi:predicted RecA/RadA family phage recombinase